MNLCVFKEQTNNKSIEIFCEEFVLFVENISLYVKSSLRQFLDFSSMKLLVFRDFLKNIYCQIQTNLNQIQIKAKIFLNGLFDVDYLSLFIGYIEDFLKYLKKSKDSSGTLFNYKKVETALESIKNTLINEKNIRDHANKNIKWFKMLNESLSEEYAGSQNTYKYLSYEILFTQSFDHGLPQPFNLPTRISSIKVIFFSARSFHNFSNLLNYGNSFLLIQKHFNYLLKELDTKKNWSFKGTRKFFFMGLESDLIPITAQIDHSTNESYSAPKVFSLYVKKDS
jgi:hypothetical protein